MTDSVDPEGILGSYVSVDEKYIRRNGKMYLVERKFMGRTLEKYDPPIHVYNVFDREAHTTWSNSTEATKS